MEQFISKILTGNYSLNHIANFDETMIIKDSPGIYTIASIGEKRVKVLTNGEEKKGFTLGITTTLMGDLLPSVIIWPTKGIRNPPKSPSQNLII